MKFSQIVNSLGMTHGHIASEIERMSGQTITRKLITYAEDGEPIALAKAELICAFFSKELGRTIKPGDISDLKVL